MHIYNSQPKAHEEKQPNNDPGEATGFIAQLSEHLVLTVRAGHPDRTITKPHNCYLATDNCSMIYVRVYEADSNIYMYKKALWTYTRTLQNADCPILGLRLLDTW